MQLLKLVSLFTFLAQDVYASATSKARSELVYQFQNVGSWAENLASRPNGNFLVTRADVPEVWLIDPVRKSGSLLKRFSDVNGTSGITAVDRDQYALVGSNIYLPSASIVPGSIKIFTIRFQVNRAVYGAIAVTNATFINGITTFDAKSGIVLLADSGAGLLWKLNLHTGAYSIVLDDPTLKSAGTGINIGINGVKMLKNYAYFTSSTQQLFCRVPLDKNTKPTGPVQIIAKTTGYFLDDFALKEDGTAYVATHPNNVVLKVEPSGKYSVVTGAPNSLEVAGATAAEFGCQGDGEKRNLYVTTDGGNVAPVNGTIVEPAKIVAINV